MCIDLNKTGTKSLVVYKGVVVKHDLSFCSSVFTPVSPISKTEILSGKILLDTAYNQIVEFYRTPGSATSLNSSPYSTKL